MKVVIYKSFFTINGNLINRQNILPRFRDKNHDIKVKISEKVPEEYTKLLGKNCGRRILPYKMQDNYSRNAVEQKIPSVVMENDFLRAEFLPSLGGRLISLYDKEEKKELLFCNKNIQMGNLAIRDGWFSGGIEWNVGQYGHALHTSDDVFASMQTDGNGNKFLRLYSFERMHHLWWHLDFYLENKLLFLHAVIHNLENTDKSLYYWTNTALKLTNKTRVFCSNNNALYLDPYALQDEKRYDYITLPKVDILPKLDASRPYEFPYSNEYFTTCNKDTVPYEVSIEADGKGFFDASTPILGYRKMFCWGQGKGGKNWQHYLSPNGNGAYFEAQAGIAPSQLHGNTLSANSKISFTQCFGSVTTNSKITQDDNYSIACDEVKSNVMNIIDEKVLADFDFKYSKNEKIKPKTILHKGSGFGYIEKKKIKTKLPKAFLLKKNSIKDNQKLYLDLVLSNKIKNIDLSNFNLDYVDYSFLPLLENAIVDNENTQNALYYIQAVALIEAEELIEAKKIIEKINKDHSLVFYLKAQLEPKKKEFYIEKACNCADSKSYPDIYFYYAELLANNKSWDKLENFLNNIIPKEYLNDDKLLLIKSELASYKKDLKTLEEISFKKVSPYIREGANPYPKLWERYMELKYGDKKAKPISNEFNFTMELPKR